MLARRVALRNSFLLVASYTFYAFWDWRFLALIAGSTLIDFVCGLRIKPGDPTTKKWLWVSLVCNLGSLAFFKYFNFFIDSAYVLLRTLGFSGEPLYLSIILPMGISFYTFQTLSYTIDRYRGDLDRETNLLNFAFFVSFFPQLVAGPIVRASEFLSQAGAVTKFRWSEQAQGLQLVVWGLFKKAVVADNFAVIADEVFGATGEVGYLARLIGVYAFTIQIYCDFSGYTDIARGCGKLLGFELPQNFRMPYFTTNPAQFWRHWHMSLSGWLKDYLYISLGGNRRTPRRTTINLSLTMLLGGLWHGAAWNFVLWGAYQGGLLGIHRMWGNRNSSVSQSKSKRGRFQTLLTWLVWINLVAFGWLLFRAISFDQIVSFVSSTEVAALAGLPLAQHVVLAGCLGLGGFIMVLIWDAFLWFKPNAETPILGLSPIAQASIVFGLYVLTSLFGRFSADEFIYFQF